MFMHGSWLHIIGNMLFLWVFGNNVEDAMGKVRFLVFYLLAGIAATALQTVVTLWVGSDMDAAVPNLGASGAVSGVLGAYLVLLPNAQRADARLLLPDRGARVLLPRLLVPVPALGGRVLARQPQAGGGVAFFAHIGGFVFGAATVRLFMKRPPLQPAY